MGLHSNLIANYHCLTLLIMMIKNQISLFPLKKSTYTFRQNSERASSSHLQKGFRHLATCIPALYIRCLYRVFYQHLKIHTPCGILKPCPAQGEATESCCQAIWLLIPSESGHSPPRFPMQTYPLPLQMTSALWKTLSCARTGQCNEPIKQQIKWGI